MQKILINGKFQSSHYNTMTFQKYFLYLQFIKKYIQERTWHALNGVCANVSNVHSPIYFINEKYPIVPQTKHFDAKSPA